MSNKFNKLTSKEKEKIKLDYLSGKSCKKISNYFKVQEESIQNWLKKMEIPIKSRGPYRRYTLNQNVFDEITSDSVYWIGFLMADASISNRKNIKRGCIIYLSISEKDITHLHKFKNFLGYSGDIRKQNRAGGWSGSMLYRLVICSEKLVEKLISYGVTPRKSLTCKVIGLEDNRDFWRGVCDGDGSIWINSINNMPFISICGSQNLMEQFACYVRKIVPLWRGNVHKSRSIYRVCIVGKNALILIKNLYKDATTYLDRKYELAKRLTGDFNG